MENEKLNLYQKLLVIQTKIKGLGQDKKSNNYSYVTGSKLLKEVKPLMNELKLLLKQEVLSIDNLRMDYKTGINTQYEKDKSEILSKVMMRFTWIDTESGEKDENLFGANGQNDWEKGLGSALTYAERYFLLKYFHIATDEDDIDNDSRKPEPKERIKIDPAEQAKKDAEIKKAIDALALTVTERINRNEIKLNACKTLEELVEVFTAFSNIEKREMEVLKNKLKVTLPTK